MLNLKGKVRDLKDKKLRNSGFIPAVLYGPKVDNLNVSVDRKEFSDIFQQAGESTLINLEIDSKKYPVLVHEAKHDPLSGDIVHLDFYQPILTEKTEVDVPLEFVGEAPAVKDLGGTLVKEIQEITVKALPQNLPHEIKVDVSGLNSFDDEILVSDLKVPENVEILKDKSDVVATVQPAADVDSELEKPIEEEGPAEETEPSEEAEESTEEKKEDEQ